jgi:Protein phosphatase 2C
LNSKKIHPLEQKSKLLLRILKSPSEVSIRKMSLWLLRVTVTPPHLGIWDCMSNQDVIDFVSVRIAAGMPLTKIAEEMTDNCLARDSVAGIGCDNMTVIIVGLYTETEKEEWAAKIQKRVPKKGEMAPLST